MLNVYHTTRAYSGRPGCMCGCVGSYNAGERARKLAITQLIKNPDARLQAWSNDNEGCIFVVTSTRNRVLYLNAAGVATARAMGFKEQV